MSDSMMHADPLLRLAEAICDGTASKEDYVRLDAMMVADPDARSRYLDYCQLHFALQLELRAQCSAKRASEQVQRESGISNGFGSQGVKMPSAIPASAFPASLPGAFGHLTSGWPMAYLAATVIVGIGLTIAGITQVSKPDAVVHSTVSVQGTHRYSALPLPSSALQVVGRITATADCQWMEKRPTDQGVSLGDHFAISSGLLEITYDTGAKVVLQGPVAYEVESKNGGFMSVGKLTGKVTNEAARGLTIRTPTAVVTDIGTEFGVEVTKEGKTTSYVFRGIVEVRKVASGKAEKPIRLTANEAVVVARQANGEASIQPAKVDPRGFVRSEQIEDLVSDQRAANTRQASRLWPLIDKTLVAWVSLDNLEQSGVGVVSIETMPEWDGIVFGELSPKKWMAGSDWWRRSEKDQSVYPVETAGKGVPVQIAVVYKGTMITLYRNGEKYVQYDTGMAQSYEKGSILLIGKRHLDIPTKRPPTLVGTIEEVRLYNMALSRSTIASLKPNMPSMISPVGCWTFEDGTARDSTEHFPVGELRGNARIEKGKLILDGKDSYLLVPSEFKQTPKAADALH